MRILSIRLHNYRGVADRRIEFPRDGVTVLEGPNEVGKSSLAEALELVFDVFDGTTSRRWKAIRPAGKDVGTEVEIEAEVGPYRFTYGKRFFKRRQTWLTFTEPKHEQLAGRDAHDKVRAILGDTIDYDLWRALQVQQGAGIVLPEGLEKAPSLLRALDQSAGGDAGDDNSELDLFEAVHAEYARYYTEDRGQARKPLQQVYADAEDAAGDVKNYEEQLENIDRHVERIEELDRTLVELEAQRTEAEANAARRERESRALHDQATELSKLELACKAARAEESAARVKRRERESQVALLERAKREHGQLEAEAVRDEPAFGDLERRLHEGRARKEAAHDRIRHADQLVDLRERDANFRNGELTLAQLTERRDRIQNAQTQAEDARALLQAARVDDAVLKELRELSFDLERTQAQLDAGSPQLKVTALRTIEAEFDGNTKSMKEGETRERTVAERSTLRLPGVVEVEVTAGTSVDELVRARDRAGDRLRDLLAQAAVADLEEAEAENERRKEALRVLELTERTIEQDLRDLDFPKLCSKVESTRRFVESYPEERPSDPPIAPDYDAAVLAKREAKQTLVVAKAEADEARAGFSATDEAWQEARRRIHETATRVRMAVEARRQAAAALKAARTETSDEDIDEALRLAERKRDSTEKEYAAARQSYQAHEPDRLKELADNARRAAASAASRSARAREERHTLQGRLQARGEDGLYERCEEARTRLAQAERELRSVERRASAARLLYTTMRRAREDARRSYVGPLRTRMLELGSVVFGHTFDLELDEELRIATRTLDGVTLPFESLSVGAQEQLSLLARVACAMTVDPREGAPLIFDDTLGYADPARLEGMGAMLAKAGEQCQIIVLTCTPDRFRHIGNAHFVRLP